MALVLVPYSLFLIIRKILSNFFYLLKEIIFNLILSPHYIRNDKMFTALTAPNHFYQNSHGWETGVSAVKSYCVDFTVQPPKFGSALSDPVCCMAPHCFSSEYFPER